MEKVTQEELEQLKKQYPSGIYEGGMSFTDDPDTFRQVECIYRKPTTADVEAHTKAAQRSPIVVNINLVQSLIVYTQAVQVIEQIRDYPAVCGRFVEEGVFSSFGSNVAVKSRKL
jgi:hypothetical protein